jgi:hypothetical protein
MAKAAEPKKRAKTYELKLAINGSFNEVMKVFAAGGSGKKEMPKKAA